MVEIVLVHRAALARREPQHPHAHLVVLEHDLRPHRAELSLVVMARNPKIRPLDRTTSGGVAVTGVVIVGTGFGCITHLRALRAAGFDVHALVGRDPEKTDRTRRDASTSRTGSPNLGDALALPGVDAVAIATPPHTHAPDRARGDRGRASTCCARSRSRATRRKRGRCSTRPRPRASCTSSAPSSAGRPGRRRWRASSSAARSARRSSRRSSCTSRCSPTPTGEVPGVVGRRRAGRRLARRAGRARGRPGARDARRDRGRERVAHAGLARATGTSKTATPCTSAPVRASTASCRARSARGDRRCSSPASPATHGTVWAEFDTVRVADADGHPRDPRPRRPPARAARSAARRSARPPPTTASTCSASRWRPYTRLCTTFLDLIEGRPVPADPAARDLRRRPRRHAGARRDPPLRPRAHLDRRSRVS